VRDGVDGSTRADWQVPADGRRCCCAAPAVALATLTVAALAFAARTDGLVYWANARTDTIGRANLDGTGANPKSMSPATSPKGWRSTTSTGPSPTTTDRPGQGRRHGHRQSFITGARSPERMASTEPTCSGRTTTPARSGGPTSTGRTSNRASSPAPAARTEWLWTAPTCIGATSAAPRSAPTPSAAPTSPAPTSTRASSRSPVPLKG
jgi:hypothetical protein